MNESKPTSPQPETRALAAHELVDGRRIRFVRVAYEFLGRMLRGELHSLAVNVPRDLKVIGVQDGQPFEDQISGHLRLYVISSEFMPVVEGMEIPEILFTYRTVES